MIHGTTKRMSLAGNTTRPTSNGSVSHDCDFWGQLLRMRPFSAKVVHCYFSLELLSFMTVLFMVFHHDILPFRLEFYSTLRQGFFRDEKNTIWDMPSIMFDLSVPWATLWHSVHTAASYQDYPFPSWSLTIGLRSITLFGLRDSDGSHINGKVGYLDSRPHDKTTRKLSRPDQGYLNASP